MDDLMHIVVLPAWYPESADDYRGSFFREQVMALKSQSSQVSVISLRFDSIFSVIRGKTSLRKENETDDLGVPTLRGHYFNFFPKLPQMQSRRWCRKGMSLFERYIETYGIPDIVYVQSMMFAGSFALEIKKKYGIPYVVSEHNSAFGRGHFGASHVKLGKLICENSYANFAVSNALKLDLLKFLGCEDYRWQVIPNSVHDQFFMRPLKKDLTGIFTFLCICSLEQNKGVEIIIRSFAKAFRDQKKVQLLIGGDGILRKDLEFLVTELGVSEQVNFLGILSRENVAREMSKADCYVLGSFYETFGVVLIEALASGLPVVVTDCGGPRDIVTKENGIIIPKGDVEVMAEALITLKKNYHSYNREEIRESCRQKFSAKNIASRLVKIFNEAQK